MRLDYHGSLSTEHMSKAHRDWVSEFAHHACLVVISLRQDAVVSERERCDRCGAMIGERHLFVPRSSPVVCDACQTSTRGRPVCRHDVVRNHKGVSCIRARAIFSGLLLRNIYTKLPCVDTSYLTATSSELRTLYPHPYHRCLLKESFCATIREFIKCDMVRQEILKNGFSSFSSERFANTVQSGSQNRRTMHEATSGGNGGTRAPNRLVAAVGPPRWPLWPTLQLPSAASPSTIQNSFAPASPSPNAK
jgi:hypothetical protein